MCRPFTELHTVQYRSTTKTLWQPLKNEWARSPRRTANIINWVKRVFSHCYFETCLKDHLLLHFVMLSRSLSLSLSYYFFLQLNQNKILNLNFPELEVQGCRKSRFFQIHSLEVFHLLLVVFLQFFLSLSDFFFFPLPSFYFPPLSSSSPIRLPHTNTQPGCKSAPGTGGHLPARRRSRQECDHWFTSQKSWNWKWELGEAQFPPHHLPPPPLTPQLVSSSGLEWRVLIPVFFYYLWGYCVSDHHVQRSAMPDFLIRYGTDFLQIPILCVVFIFVMTNYNT